MAWSAEPGDGWLAAGNSRRLSSIAMKAAVRDERGQLSSVSGWGAKGWHALVFAYLIRFPIIAAASLVLVPYFSGEGRALEALVGGAFELSQIGTIYVMLGGFTLAWTILVTIRIIWL